ncbi:MerR family DNA-binding protein [Thalassotalea sp. 1_MG-2023]|uniref:MerR family DNA-binding protein n=1 Tax=Thalassotalea sp. 1_MG-2023 TaxID=3062680 RepID=UPI0026E2D2B7|nr:MerR family DNA-binding protein [Thalassotalea sp. 1_MG-2023]MDO6427547.1 MerR family DNA-binding protein [Thalassotalea sp. 1_MG-2023]
MRVKQLATRNNINIDTVKYYTRIGLLTPTTNPVNNYKDYNFADEQRLQFIVQAKSLGFSLHDIKLIIEQSTQGQSPCQKVREIMQQRLTEIKHKIDAMQQTYYTMKEATKHWQQLPDCVPTGNHVCHLIESFDKGNSHHD